MVAVVRAARPAPPRVQRLVVAAVAAVPLAVFAGLLVLVRLRWHPLAALDAQVAAGLHRTALRHSSLVLCMKIVSTLGTSAAYLLVFAVVLAWLVRRGRARAAAFVAVTLIGGTVLNTLVKAAVDRPRPVFPQAVARAGYSSFPSGHAQGVSVALGVALVVLLPSAPAAARRAGVAGGTAWALTVGFARLALGVHYLSDVVAGYALGAAWVLLMCAAFGLAGTRPAGSPG